MRACVRVCVPGFGISFPSNARGPLWLSFLPPSSLSSSALARLMSLPSEKNEAFSTRRNPLIIQEKRQAATSGSNATQLLFPQLWTRLVPAAGPRPFLALPPHSIHLLSTLEGFQRKPRLVCTSRINTGLVESGGEGEAASRGKREPACFSSP